VEGYFGVIKGVSVGRKELIGESVSLIQLVGDILCGRRVGGIVRDLQIDS
jgi:hypothetical protein